MIVVMLIGIAFVLAIPTTGETKVLRLREAARILTADIELARNESITHAEDPRLVKFDTGANEYWIAAQSDAGTPIDDPIRQAPCRVSLGSGRASGVAGVSIQSIDLDGDDELHFNAYGVPDQSTSALITLQCGSLTMMVQVEAGTGEVTVTEP